MKKIYIDFEQVFDVWSLVFCICRSSLRMSNKDYDKIVNKTISDSILTLCPDTHSDLLNTFETYLPSVKPWIPYIQFIYQVSTSQKVILRPTIEQKYVDYIMKLHPKLFESVTVSQEEPELDSIIFSSNKDIKSSYYLVPRKLEEGGFQELSDVPLGNLGFKATETQKYVDFKNNQIVKDLPEF